LRLPDRAQASRKSTDHERTYEDSVPGRADPLQANQEVDLLQAGRSENQTNQEGHSGESIGTASCCEPVSRPDSYGLQ